jgi:hypothetical protein
VLDVREQLLVPATERLVVDPSELGLRRHEVYLTDDEAIFLFEAEQGCTVSSGSLRCCCLGCRGGGTAGR